MGSRRPHSDRTASQMLAKDAKYRELQRRTSDSKEQPNRGFDSVPPSRLDAKQLVEERRKAKTSGVLKPKVVGAMGSDGTVRKSGQNSAARPSRNPPRKRTVGSKPAPVKKPAQKAGIIPTSKKRGVKRKKKRPVARVEMPLTAFVIAVVVIAVIIGSLLAWRIDGGRKLAPASAATDGAAPESGEIVIDPGMHARQISQLLADAGVVADSASFERYLEASGNATRLQPGVYRFGTGLSHAEVAAMLVQRPVSMVRRVVAYPGYTLKDIDALLSDQDLAVPGAFMYAAEDLAAQRGLPFAEGWFLSGTYEVDAADAAENLAIAMQDALNDAVRPYLVLLEDLNVTLSDVVIIASLVQRETNETTQMPQIAGIIYNRLRAGMPLGIDATTRYELDAWEEPLRVEDLEAQTPYNTRRRIGLPPTGIGSPGPAAIDAAMRPTAHNWYYYLHDTEGNIHYASTYEGHKENIERYL